MIIFIVLGVFCLAGAAYFVGDAVTLPARERRVSVRRAANYGKVRSILGGPNLLHDYILLAPQLLGVE